MNRHFLKRELIEKNDRTHLLILGIGRSGTSLLQSIVGAHKDVGMLFEDREYKWFEIVGKKVVGTKIGVSNQISWNHTFNWFHRKSWPYIFDLKYKVPTTILGRLVYPLCIKDYIDCDIRLKIIWISRNQESIENSLFKRELLPFYRCRKSYINKVIEEGRQTLNQLKLYTSLQNRFLQVTYEDLIQKTEKICQDICSFLNLDYDSNMIKGSAQNIQYPEFKKVEQR